MAFRGLWGAGAGKVCEGCSGAGSKARVAWRWSISIGHSQVAAPPGCSTSNYIAASAAEPVAGGKPVSIMQNIADDLLDGGAELHYTTGDAGDRAG
eukprot:5756260-Prymnesium_polylepis.1